MRSRPPVTVGELFRSAVRRFERSKLHFGHGTHTAPDEAAYLILHGLGLPIESIAPYLRRELTARERRRLEALIERRIARRLPAAYLTREAWLGDLSFYVDRRAIIPRSFIAELLRQEVKPWLHCRPRRILDLCTGSGCLAILAASVWPDARVDATDISAAALAVARRNVRRYHLSRRIRLVASDLYSALAGARYDLIVCNPPYVTLAAMRRLPAEYRHEPALALAGGHDGLDAVRRIVDEAAAHLAPRGMLVCEIGRNRRALERAYPATPFVWPELGAGSGSVFLIQRDQLPRASAD
jgi:ribosomal protein L3 glutamine methyltransferase